MDFLVIDSLLYFWSFFIFALGAAMGSFLNVAIARLPVEKSLLWPDSRCGHCLQSVRWYDNLPLLSYLWLRGRCRHCGTTFSSMYFFVELATALGFLGLFYLEVVRNIHQWPGHPGIQNGPLFYPWSWWAGFVHHAVLYSLLLAASVSDLLHREIPLPLTITGTILGLIGAVLMPWPWPQDVLQALPASLERNASMAWQGGVIREGIYAWPVWGPLPDWLEPGSPLLGLSTGLAGILVGTFLLRSIGFLFGTGLGKEALGLGDADLMMMAGAFLGWQIVVVGFFLSIVPALVFGVILLLVHKDNSLPFGPSLSVGVMAAALGWPWIGPHVQLLLFWGPVLLGLVVASGGILFLMAFALRLIQGGPPDGVEP